jgi:anti-sigma factor (TIGR02949 family)
MKEDCKKIFERISEYLDGELGPDACQEIEQHLMECPECMDCFDALKKSIALCRKSTREEIPQDMRERLRSNLKDCFGSH